MSSKLFESLERRLNLSATFDISNLAGTHEFYTNTGTGSLTIAANGTVSAGSVRFNDVVRTVTGTLSMDRAGAVNGGLALSGLGTLNVSGAFAGAKDFLQLAGSVGQPEGNQQVFTGVLVVNQGTYTQPDLQGTWTVLSERLRGSVSIASTGAVTGSYTMASGSGGTIGGSSKFTISSTGAVTGPFVLTGASGAAYAVTLTMGTQKDVIVGTIVGNGRFDQVFFYRNGSGANNARLQGEYRYSDTLSNGWVGFDGSGNVRGSVNVIGATGQSALSGTYTVGSTGTVTGSIALAATPGFFGYTYNFVGAINSAGTIVTLYDTVVQSSNNPVPAIVNVVSSEPGAFATPSGGTLTIVGRKSNETFGLAINGSNLEVTRGLITKRFSSSSVTSIVLYADEGNDVVNVGTGVIATTLYGEAGNDSLTGGGANDLIYGGTGNDTVRGGVGVDTIYGDDGFDNIAGGQGNDFLYGGNQGDTITGAAGNDVIGGGKGYDSLDGGDGNDQLTGGLGLDTLIGGTGDDTFYARDATRDTIIGGSDDTVDRAQIDSGTDLVSEVESLLA